MRQVNGELPIILDTGVRGLSVVGVFRPHKLNILFSEWNKPYRMHIFANHTQPLAGPTHKIFPHSSIPMVLGAVPVSGISKPV